MREHIGKNGKASKRLGDFNLFDFEGSHDSLEHDFMEEPLEIEGAVGEGVGKGDDVVLVGRAVLEVECVVGIVLVVFA